MYKRTLNVSIATLKLPRGWDKDLDDKTLDRLVESLKRGDQLQPIGISPQRKVLWGHHRVAAHRLCKLPTVRAEIHHLDEASAERAALEENVCRREISLSERAEAVARLKRILEGLDSEDVGKGASRPAGNRSPVDRIAKASGRDSESVREDAQIGETLTREQRDALEAAEVPRKKWLEVASLADPEDRRRAVERLLDPTASPPVDLLGAKPPAARVDHIRVVVDAFDASIDALKTADKALKDITSEPLYGSQAQQAIATIHEAASRLRSTRPAFLCPTCFGDDETCDESCDTCKGGGYVSRSSYDHAMKKKGKGK